MSAEGPAGRGRRGGELPAEVTGFVGRERELASVERLLGRARLLTLTGPGGVGKTRVALRVAAGLRDRHPDGIFLIELSELKDPELLPGTVCAVLGLTGQSPLPALDLLIEYLVDRRVLLLLDTCEHLVDACAMLADLLLRDAPGVSILATSRQPLDVPGEHTLVIPPLPVEPEGADGTGAVALFAQRAAAAAPGFALTEANRADVLALCRRLDGIPLAIELATVRLRAIPLEQLTARLEDRFQLLTGGRRTALPRHQTLRTTIGWSHELCTPQERLLWARLSVFAGSFTLAGAEQVCAGGELDAEAVLEHLIGLVDKSVVLRVDDSRGARYRLLDTIREYGAEWLAQSGGEERLRHRHLSHYRDLAREFRRSFFGSEQVPRFLVLRRELPDLRAALDFALSRPELTGQALSFSADLWVFWVCAGLLAEGRRWLRRAVAGVSGAGGPEEGIAGVEAVEISVGEVRALTVLGHFALLMGDHEEARRLLLTARPLAAELADPRLLGHVEQFLALHAAANGRLAEAEEYFHRALALVEPAGDRLALAMLGAARTAGLGTYGRPEDAVRVSTAALAAMADVPGEAWIRGFLLVFQGIALWRQGESERCAAVAMEALRVKGELSDTVGIGYILELLAWNAVSQRRPLRAAWLLGAAEERWLLSGCPLSGVGMLQSYHAENRRLAREELGADCYDQYAAAGRRLDFDEVVRQALADTDVLATAPALPRAAEADRPEPLTPREREVAALVATGLSNREVAERLVISKRTADAHVEHILAKLGCSSRTEISAAL